MCFDGGVYNLTFSVLRLCRLVRGVQVPIFCSLEKGVYNLTFSDLSGIWQKCVLCVFNRLYYCRCLMCFDGGVYNLTFLTIEWMVNAFTLFLFSLENRFVCAFRNAVGPHWWCHLIPFYGGVYNLTFSASRQCHLVRGVQVPIFFSLEKEVYNLTFSDLSGIWRKCVFCVFNRLYYCQCLMCFDGGVYNLTFFDHQVNGERLHIIFV